MKLISTILILTLVAFSCKRKITNALPIVKETNNSRTDMYIDDEIELKSVWNQLNEAAKEKNRNQFKKVSLDTILVCNKNLDAGLFLSTCASELFNDSLYMRIIDTVNISIQTREVISHYYPDHFLELLRLHDSTFFIQRIQIDMSNNEPHFITFDFVNTKKGYKFFSCDVYGGPDCCN